MVKSKYLEAFQAEGLSDLVELYGDAILVEIPKDEPIKTSSGIYIATTEKVGLDSLSKDKPYFVHVIAVGKGYYDEETHEDVPLNVQPGDIILIGANSAKRFSHMEVNGYEAYSIGLTRESEIQLRFKGLDAYNRYFELINSTIKSKVSS